MSDEMHCLVRTSPIGQKFLGTCTRCGKTDLPMGDMSPCENVRGVTQEGALLEVLNWPKPEKRN